MRKREREKGENWVGQRMQNLREENCIKRKGSFHEGLG